MKDYTDYCAVILQYDHCYKMFHIRERTGRKPVTVLNWRERCYHLSRSRAWTLHGWIPWFSFDWDHPYKSLKELLRRKRIGVLVFNEPKYGEQALEPIESILPSDKDYSGTSPLTIKNWYAGFEQKYGAARKSVKWGPGFNLAGRWKMYILVFSILVFLYLLLSGKLPFFGGF